MLTTSGVLLCSAGMALAQRRPTGGPPELEGRVPWLAILMTVLAFVLIALVAFKPSKRTHLD